MSATRLGVLGWPVWHSRSPAIQNAALQAAGLRDWRYQLLPVAPELFAETVRALPAAGLRGANVTIPHKQPALSLCDVPSPRARAIGAANTLLFEPDGSIHGENTDAPAIIEALPFAVRGLTALVLGAGGSARAAVWALLDAGAREVRVWNRTPERAAGLCAELGCVSVQQAQPADILINCTSIGLDAPDWTFKQLPVDADDLARYRCVLDLVYSENTTELVRAARVRSVAAVDGVEVLIRQGALSFELFTGAPADILAMRAAVGRS